MSYCRFSSDDWRCDFYIYESDHGWEMHVAGRRHVMRDLPPPVEGDPTSGAYIGALIVRMGDVFNQARRAPLVDIDLPHAGDSFHFDTPGACADKVEELVALGYHVAPGVVEELRSEQASLS